MLYDYSVEYEYTVDGKSHRSDEITFADPPRRSVRGWVVKGRARKYPLGKTVTVYYDPHDPSFSVLELEKGDYHSNDLRFLMISALMSAISLGYLRMSRGALPSTKRPAN
jgi:hypothetical protein